MTLPLTPDELLTSTRGVRKRLDFDRPVELDVVRKCLEIALQAPTGSNAQGWHFVLVTDAEKRRRIAELYAQAFEGYRSMPFSARAIAKERIPPPMANMAQASVFGSILPAVWSFAPRRSLDAVLHVDAW